MTATTRHLCYGIDPGLQGGVIVTSGAEVFHAVRLARDVDGMRDQVREMLLLYGPGPWFVEVQAAMPRQGRVAIASMMYRAGLLTGILAQADQTPTLLRPEQWQRACDVPRGHGKAGAVSVAMRLWPELQRLTAGWRVASVEGACDAALIALAGMRLSRRISH